MNAKKITKKTKGQTEANNTQDIIMFKSSFVFKI